MDIDRNYRDALGRFPTGVALVTLSDEGRALAMTVNSFSSVSLDPPLILWSVDHNSRRYELFRNTPRFAVNVLAADQEALSNACARNEDLSASGADWSTGEGGAPLVEGCVARFECSLEAIHPAGDHDIILGRVTHFDMPRKVPALVFHRSAYEKAG
ncbi:flavin reductase family protein [Maricaulaceae bacterium EIL42A08]|nr:flavin reductase family protein [Maricaulaceae bacterium EIL42A08]MCP2679660.1 flavin reductase family protein [Maricaulaceae bacterium NA33B04]